MRCLLRKQLKYLLVVLLSILACLWFLSILMASSPYLTWNVLIIICMFILLRCQLSDMSDSLFSMVLMFSPLIYRMLIYIFLLLSIIINSYDFFCTMCLISGVLPFGLATAPWVFTALTKPILFLCCCKGFHTVIYLDDILVLVHSKQAGRRAHSFLCSLLVRLGLHINFSKSELCLTQTFFLGLWWDTVHMSVSLPPDKLADIQQWALSLLQSQHVTVYQVMSFLGKANFCTNGHYQLWHLCCVIQSDMLHVYHSPTHFLSQVIFPFPHYIN